MNNTNSTDSNKSQPTPFEKKGADQNPSSPPTKGDEPKTDKPDVAAPGEKADATGVSAR